MMEKQPGEMTGSLFVRRRLGLLLGLDKGFSASLSLKLDPTVDHHPAASKPAFLQLFPELIGGTASFLPALSQIRAIRINGTLRARNPLKFRKTGSLNKLAHGLPADLELPGNPLNRSPEPRQLNNLLIERLAPSARSLGADSFAARPFLTGRDLPTCILWHLGVAEKPLNGFPKIFEQMPAINDLLGLWSAVGCSTQVFLAAISADDFHTGMLPEPFGKGFRAAVFEEVYWLVCL